MNLLSIITTISLVVIFTISNGIGLILMDLRYIEVVRGTPDDERRRG